MRRAQHKVRAIKTRYHLGCQTKIWPGLKGELTRRSNHYHKGIVTINKSDRNGPISLKIIIIAIFIQETKTQKGTILANRLLKREDQRPICKILHLVISFTSQRK